jgi:putative membrane protein
MRFTAGGFRPGRQTLKNKITSEETGRRLVYFAAERTLMAWIRTALGIMALGFVIDRFGLVLRQVMPPESIHLYPRAFSFWAGTILVVIGTAMALAAAVRYLRFALSYHREGSTQPRHGILVGVLFTFLLAIMGGVITVFLVIATE